MYIRFEDDANNIITSEIVSISYEKRMFVGNGPSYLMKINILPYENKNVVVDGVGKRFSTKELCIRAIKNLNEKFKEGKNEIINLDDI